MESASNSFKEITISLEQNEENISIETRATT